MKNQLMIFALFGILITSVGITPTFGEDGSVVVSTDKSSYSESDLILISGEIKYIALGDQLSLIIQAPNGNIVQLDQMTVGSDKKFSAEINPNGPYWKTPGIYKITITQNENNHATMSFEFTGITSIPVEGVTAEEGPVEGVTAEGVTAEEGPVEEGPVEGVTAEEGPVEGVTAEEGPVEAIVIDSIITETTITIQDSTDLISYEITNGKVINVIPDMDAVSLLVHIESIDDGSITLTIPRSVLDATIDNGDDQFFVLVDGEEVDFEETITSTDRTLTINFLAGTEEIEIIGTFVIPEFGTIAAMILAVAIISIIAISSKSRLGMSSRY
ncbi:PEFG-CTERM sorting domain-containing protein [Nitrosopumilus sp.]|nr:PEFG-CTERM sorting domain-containing protein [Nitrosopumilus sp.]